MRFVGLRHPLHGLLAVLSLTLAAVPVAQAPVSGVTVSTDRMDYVLGMTVTATAAIAYSGSFVQIDEPARVEWRNGTWALARAEYVPKTRISSIAAESIASWAPPAPGTWHVNVSANTTNGTPPTWTGSGAFTVWDPDDYVIARGIAVATDRGGYERGSPVIATANLTLLPGWLFGNVSRLERVQFNWYYPTGAPARLFVNVSVANGEASDAWSPDQVGSLYTVSVSYLGNDSVSNATSFPVFPSTTLAANVTAGQSVTWDAARSPWRVCGALDVAPTGTLTIEANVTVRFCRGSRLVVRGVMQGDGAPTAPIAFTSNEFPAAAGDWEGIWFEGFQASRLSRASVEFVRNGIVAVGSSPLLTGIALRQGTGEALNLTDSSATVSGIVVTGFLRGIHLRNSSASLANVTVSGHAREGILAEGSAPSFAQIQVVGGNYSLRGILVNSLKVDGATLAAAAIRAVDLTGTSAVIANATIASAGQDFLLVASTATLLNCAFVDDPLERQIVTPSRLIVQNFLTVEVRTPGGQPVAGARVVVMKNGPQWASRTTDARGVAAWIAVEDRVYNATAVSKNQIEVSVSKAGYSVEATRLVDMTVSRTEVFVATPLGGPVNGGDARVFLVGLLSVVFLASLLLLWRRRSRPREAPETPSVPFEVPSFEAVPGTSYALLGDRPEPAFLRFAADVAAGAPGLCITRIHPEKARERYALAGVPVHWLSRSFSKDTLNPTNLGAIVELVQKHAAGHPGSRVLLDGLEYLYTQNDFGKVAKFVQVLADIVSEEKAILYMPLDPRTLEDEERAILLRDLRTWP